MALVSILPDGTRHIRPEDGDPIEIDGKCISLKRLVFLIFKYKCNIRALSQTAKSLNDQRKKSKG